MRNQTFLLILCLVLAIGLPRGVSADAAQCEAAFLQNTRQLIYEGRRSGEGYFSSDGRELVFQSEREPGNPFYQIYLLNLETGDTERISPGTGKTTCSWISPDAGRVLFASTHEDPAAARKQADELEFRASGKQRRYAWDYDENFELYALDRKTRAITRLTNIRGYDAEGCYSPDGSLIAFTSNRLAYERQNSMDEAEKAHLEHDPSYFCDLFIMNADGTRVRLLSSKPGYDGGPFFSPDGRRICFRRFDESGAIADVYTIAVDGTDERQITHLGAMSWAPFYHPSGQYLVFTTNLHGFANFELYLVSVEGGEPIRVTCTDGFDGLPAFSADGRRMVWTSTRTADKAAQIFIADWNHEQALQAIREMRSRAETLDQIVQAHATKPTTQDITVADLKQRVAILADERTEGRMTGTRGEWLATEYVAREFHRLGLAPGGDHGGYFQEFEFSAGVALDEGNQFVASWPQMPGEPVSPKDFVLDTDWRPLAFSATGAIEPTEMRFAGYGIVAPAEGEQPAYDSYKNLDVSGKWVLALRFVPENIDDKRRQHLNRYASLRYKVMLARDHGAKGLIIVTGPAVGVKNELIALENDASSGKTSLPVVSITNATAEAFYAPGGTTFASHVAGIGADGGVAGTGGVGVHIAGNIALRSEMRRGRNVIGCTTWRSAAAPPPTVIVGAHVDHLGRGRSGNSLARDEEKDAIHYGADDNASGVAAMLEIAENLMATGLEAAASQTSGAEGRRREQYCFIAWSGEELGLIGSKHYVDTLVGGSGGDIPRGKAEAYLNLDMVGRLTDKLILSGVGSSTAWKREIEKRNAVVGLPLALQEDGYLPTDATSFYLKGVPILSAFTGGHAEYHTPRDTPEKLNYDGMQKVTRLFALLTRGLATDAEVIDFVPPSKPAPALASGSRANLRAYLGTIPDYAPMDTPGLKLSGVASGGPAHAGGLRGGDIIIELAGKKVENVYDYTYALEALQVGKPVKCVVLRDGQRIEMEITPGSRE